MKNSIKSKTLERGESQETTMNSEIAVPMQQAPRPMTLPHRSSNSNKLYNKNDEDDGGTNPLRILRDKNYPIVIRPRPKNIKTDQELIGNSMKTLLLLNGGGQIIPDGTENLNDWSCEESPSYLTNINSYTFPSSGSVSGSGSGCKNIHDCVDSSIASLNPIPLPPRDRNKVMPANVKRHVRKHPLIIPGYGVQRTLNKVTEITPIDEHPQFPFPSKNNDTKTNFNTSKHHQSIQNNENHKFNDSNNQMNKITQQIVNTYDNIIINNDLKNIINYSNKCLIDDDRTYENINDLNQTLTDSASLDFETILEDDFNKGETLSSPDADADGDVIDGFCPFAIQKEQYKKSKEINFKNSKMLSGLYVNEDEFRNLDIEKKKVEIKQSVPSNELEGHVLFNKIKQNVNLAMEESNKPQILDEPPDCSSVTQSLAKCPINNHSELNLHNNGTAEDAEEEIKQQEVEKLEEEKMLQLKNMNSVSCEDLLEFADKKPKGCERGVDSDEVRIMLKVLGKDFSPHKCLKTLEFIEWDVHKALKLIRLQNIMESVDLSLNESIEALQKYDWDIETTALKLKGFKLRLS